MIEEGRTNDDPLVDTALRQYLQGMILRKIDVLVLGCTHYPLLKRAIAKVIGPQVQLIDSAEQCAQDVARRLQRKGLLRREESSSDDTAPMDGQEQATGSLRAFVTDDPNRFVLLAARFLGMEIAAADAGRAARLAGDRGPAAAAGNGIGEVASGRWLVIGGLWWAIY